MNKASKAIGLVLVGSAAILLGYHSCESDEDFAAEEWSGGQRTTSSTRPGGVGTGYHSGAGPHYFMPYRPWYRRPWFGLGSGSGGTRYRSGGGVYVPSPSRWGGVSSGSHSDPSSGSHSSGTSRGGFGGSGHAAGS